MQSRIARLKGRRDRITTKPIARGECIALPALLEAKRSRRVLDVFLARAAFELAAIAKRRNVFRTSPHRRLRMTSRPRIEQRGSSLRSGPIRRGADRGADRIPPPARSSLRRASTRASLM